MLSRRRRASRPAIRVREVCRRMAFTSPRSFKPCWIAFSASECCFDEHLVAGRREIELPLHGGELVVVLERGRRGAIADLVGRIAANLPRQVGDSPRWWVKACAGASLAGWESSSAASGALRTASARHSAAVSRRYCAGRAGRALRRCGERRDVGLDGSARYGLELGRGGADRRGEFAGATPGQETQQAGQHHASRS